MDFGELSAEVGTDCERRNSNHFMPENDRAAILLQRRCTAVILPANQPFSTLETSLFCPVTISVQPGTGGSSRLAHAEPAAHLSVSAVFDAEETLVVRPPAFVQTNPLISIPLPAEPAAEGRQFILLFPPRAFAWAGW
jgi:hypothetical protein